MDANDLINPLRYVNLKNINPESINRMGEGVFPEPGTLDHLAIIDLVTKAYQGVHMPTLGHPIPQSTTVSGVSVSTSETSKTLVTASSNEVIEIVALAVKTPANYELGSGNYLAITTAAGDTGKIMDLSRMEYICSSGSGVFYGIDVFDPGNDGGTPQHFNPKKLLVNGGDTLVLILAGAPASNMTIEIVSRKVIQ